ncbi:MAG: hypothetical protein CVV03_02360 [Firmicutes bacterium HGW-Firmicutes-8]|nr:MAG: hypothetical protein CVV03_02360 [Firmicutes bacterium HGW-Firmicutes-8]
MAVGKRRIYISVFFAVFLLILLIGIQSEVSAAACVIRAFSAAVFFTALCWVAVQVIGGHIISTVIIPELNKKIDNSDIGANLGKKLDLTVSEPPIPEGLKAGDASGKTGLPPQFVPLAAQQIDPQVNNLIVSDPERTAEIVRKMGFDE